MDFFDKYVSDCAGGSGSQSFFCPENPGEKQTARVYYKVTWGGKRGYSALFSNIIDSTFADGSHSAMNRIVDAWQIHSLKVGVCEEAFMDVCAEPKEFIPLTFGGKAGKSVAPGEFFCTDEFAAGIEAGQYFCFEIEFSGAMIPHHPESLLPGFVKKDEVWMPSRELPFLSMVGCDRPVKKRIAFLGDSITQGIGTAPNSYAHVAALIAKRLGPDYAVWDLGLGYGRAHDAASDGAWLYKARQNDILVLCYGVNDLFRVEGGHRIIEDERVILSRLRESGVKVLIETVPPFNYTGETTETWKAVNEAIRNELSREADGFFDCVPVLGAGGDTPEIARYGGHPEEKGNAAWAEALYPELCRLL